MLFPLVVDDVEHHALLELAHYLAAVAFGCCLEVDGNVIDTLAVGDRDEDVLVHRAALLVHLLDDRVSHLLQRLHAAFEGVHSGFCQLLSQCAFACALEGILVERHLHGEHLHDVELQPLIVHGFACVGNDSLGGVVNHVGDVHADTLTHQGVMTLGIDDIALLVHHIVVLNQTLADTEVVLLHLLLRTLNGVGNHRVLNHLAVLEAHLVHNACQTVGAEHTHQVVLHADIEDAATRVALTSCTSAQLAVHTTALVTLGAYDGKTARSLYFGGEFDIGTTTCHVGGDSYYARATCLRHNLRLTLVQLGVQHIVRYLAEVQHSAQQLADFHAGSTYQHRTPCAHECHNLVDDGVVLLALGAVDTVVHIDTRNGLVGRDNHHVQLVDVPELARLRLGGTGHTRQLLVHTEVVLQCDGGKGLCGPLHFHILFRLHRLVQAVRPATPFHHTAGLLIDNLHLVVVDDIIHVLFEEGVCLK